MQQHEMQLTVKYPTGAEEWRCPVCGRRIIVMPPSGSTTVALERGDKYILVWGPAIGTVTAAKILLEPGEEQAIHHGAVLAETDPCSCDENADVWEEWLRDVDLSEL